MRHRLSVALVVIAGAFARAQTSAPGFKDAAALLDAVAKNYAADSPTFHLEAIVEEVQNSELERSWRKTVITTVKGEGKQFRIEVRTPMGTWLQESDGRTEWVYVAEGHVYVKRSAGDAPQFPKMYGPGTMALRNAWEMRTLLRADIEQAKNATMLPDETITIAGDSYPCYVTHATSEGDGDLTDHTHWIEKQTLLLRKKLEHRDSHLLITSEIRIPLHGNGTTVYPVAHLKAQDGPELFRFNPPADAKEVSTLEQQMRNFQLTVPENLGKPAPDISLTGANGKEVKLSSYRGHPLFIDVWATWCAPCLIWMPSLGKLEREMRAKGLQVISVDRDKESASATHYLAVHGFTWPNYHDAAGKLGEAFNRNQIPLAALIDAQGRVTYISSDSNEDELRKAIAGLT